MSKPKEEQLTHRAGLPKWSRSRNRNSGFAMIVSHSLGSPFGVPQYGFLLCLGIGLRELMPQWFFKICKPND